MPPKGTKKPKNRYARSAKYSEYKTLQLLECFARDLPVREAARATRMSERTVRDRYAEIRAKLLPWCTEQPDLFNGFGHLLLDPDGNINLHVLEALFYYAESPGFKARMAKRYPKFKAAKDPVLNHVIEMALRRFNAMEPPEANGDFRELVKRVFAATQSETFLMQHGRRLSAYRARQYYWKAAGLRLGREKGSSIRRFSHSAGERFYRDLKYMLRHDPL